MFVLLVVTIVIEAGVFFYYRSLYSSRVVKTPAISSDNQVSEVEAQITPFIPTQTPNTEQALDKVLTQNIIDSSSNINKNLLKSYVISVEIEGEIKTIVVPTPRAPKDPYEHILRFEMVLAGENDAIHTIRNSYDFKGQESIITVVNENGENLTLNDLQVGDIVNVKIDMDLTKSKDGITLYRWTIKAL